MTQIIKQIFSQEITEQGLSDLKEKYPEDLVIDMTNDAEFKAARKTRTEMNKLVDKIDRRRLDVTGDLKEYGDNLIKEVENIYNVVVIPFEKEDKAKKNKKAEDAIKHQKLIDGEVKRIKEIYGFIEDSRGKNSKSIQGAIEAVDLIETDMFNKDVIHEAIEAKKSTLHDLAQLLSDTISREKVQAEREELRAKEEKAAAKEKIEERINFLRMIPTNLFGESSDVIRRKKIALKEFTVTHEEFGDRDKEVNDSVSLVNKQLGQMLENSIMIEQIEKTEAAQKVKEEESKAAEDLVSELLINHDEALLINEKLDSDKAKKIKQQKEREDKIAQKASEDATQKEVERQEEVNKAEAKRLEDLEADKKHVGKIRGEIKDHIMKCGLDNDTAKKVVIALTKCERVTINY